MNYRSVIVRLATFLGGLYFFLEFFLPAEIVKIDRYNDQITNGFMAIGALAIGLGLINIFLVHGLKIAFKRSGWPNSAALLISFFAMMLISFADWSNNESISKQSARIFILRDFAEKITIDFQAGKISEKEFDNKRELMLSDFKSLNSQLELALIDHQHIQGIGKSAEKLKLGLQNARKALDQVAGAKDLTAVAPAFGELGGSIADFYQKTYSVTYTKRLYQLLYDGLFVSLGSAMFALLGFYIASAAYRAFRIRNFESALMLLAAVVVMLGQIPFGQWISESLPAVRLWILEVPNAAAFRAVKIGASVAALVMAFRMWLSLESESFSADKK